MKREELKVGIKVVTIDKVYKENLYEVAEISNIKSAVREGYIETVFYTCLNGKDNYYCSMLSSAFIEKFKVYELDDSILTDPQKEIRDLLGEKVTVPIFKIASQYAYWICKNEEEVKFIRNFSLPWKEVKFIRNFSSPWINRSMGASVSLVYLGIDEEIVEKIGRIALRGNSEDFTIKD